MMTVECLPISQSFTGSLNANEVWNTGFALSGLSGYNNAVDVPSTLGSCSLGLYEQRTTPAVASVSIALTYWSWI